MKTLLPRRLLLRLGWLLVGLALVAGCKKVNHYWEELRPTGQEINLLLWQDYISADIIAKFERDYGIRVNVTPIYSNEDLYHVLRGEDPTRKGPFDLAMPSSFLAKYLVAKGMLVPFIRLKGNNTFVNLTNLNPTDNFERAGETNRAEVFDKSYNPKFDPNNSYLIPYIWGATGIGYSADRVSHLPMSWASFFTRVPHQTRRIALLDDPRFTLGSALIYQIYQRYSHGVLSPQEVSTRVANDFANATAEDIEKAGELIKAMGPDVVSISNDHVPEMLASGDVDMALAWAGDVAVGMLRGRVDPPANQPPQVQPNLNIRLSLPIEGVIVFRDCFVIPRQRRNQEGAEKFINFLLTPEIAGAVSNYSCYATTVKGAAAIVEPEITNSAAYFIHPYRSRNLYLEDGNVIATDEVYAAVWDDVKRSFPPGVLKYPPEPATITAELLAPTPRVKGAKLDLPPVPVP